MPRQIEERTRLTPRAVMLNAIDAAVTRGGPDVLVTGMWAHAALVARIARELAPVADVDPADATAAGLLHDVGELVLLARHPADYGSIAAAASHREQLSVEKTVFGTDHALLGAEHLLDRRIPDVIADAVADHHGPFPDSAATTVVVAAADEIVGADPDRRHALELLGILPATASMILRAALGDPNDALLTRDCDRTTTQ